MKPTQALHEAGQSLWLDNITRTLLDEGILTRYVDEYSVTGLTSNPTIFDKAIKDGSAYDADIAARKASGASDEEVFFELALADLRRAAGLFTPVHARTDKVDGWGSLEGAPLLAHDTPRTVDQAEGLHRRAALDNLFIKIPGTPEGMPAIEEGICTAVPVNVTLLFSAEQYQAAAEAYLRRGAPDPGRPQSGRGLGCLAVRIPLGHRGGRPGARRPPRPPGHRRGQAGLPGVPRAAGLAPLVAAGQRGGPDAAAALGLDLGQGP